MTRTVIVDETEEMLLAAYDRLRTLGPDVQEAFACHVFALATEWAEKDQVTPRGQDWRGRSESCRAARRGEGRRCAMTTRRSEEQLAAHVAVDIALSALQGLKALNRAIRVAVPCTITEVGAAHHLTVH